MYSAKIDFRNPLTNKVESIELEEKKPRTPKPRDKDFLRMRPQALYHLSQSDLSGAEFKVLMHLIAGCPWSNYTHVRRNEIQEQTGLSRKSVYNALEKLAADYFIVFPGSDMRDACWIDPIYCWKGHTEQLAAASAEFDKMKRSGVPAARLRANTKKPSVP